MAQRKVTILSKAVEEVASIAYFIESSTAKKFVDESFTFFEKLGNSKIKHKPCTFEIWNVQGFDAPTFEKNML